MTSSDKWFPEGYSPDISTERWLELPSLEKLVDQAQEQKGKTRRFTAEQIISILKQAEASILTRRSEEQNDF